MSDSTAEIAYVEAQIDKLLTLLRGAKDDGSRFYYRACIRGWKTTLNKLRAKG